MVTLWVLQICTSVVQENTQCWLAHSKEPLQMLIFLLVSSYHYTSQTSISTHSLPYHQFHVHFEDIDAFSQYLCQECLLGVHYSQQLLHKDNICSMAGLQKVDIWLDYIQQMSHHIKGTRELLRWFLCTHLQVPAYI